MKTSGIIGLFLVLFAVMYFGVAALISLNLPFYLNGTWEADRPGLNLEEGANVTITVAGTPDYLTYILSASGGGGSAQTLDLGDDDVNESVDLQELATTGDTNSIFSEPSANKLLIDLGNNWPQADTATALAANGGNCSAGSYPLGVDAAGAVESCTVAQYQTIEDETSGLTQRAILNFAGAGVSCADDTTKTTCTISGVAGTGYDTIEDETTPLTQRTSLNFAGAGVSCADDTTKTTCTIAGGGSANSFETIAPTAGDSVVADAADDTLTLTSTGSTITITGTAASDTLNFEAVDVTCTGCLGSTEIAGLDISADTNLTAGRSLTLTDDDVLADAELYTYTKGIVLIVFDETDDIESWYRFDNAATIISIWCETDTGTADIDIQIDDGTPADVNGTDITCTSSGVEDVSFAGDTTAADGDRLDLVITSVDSAPARLSVFVTYTADD